MAMSPDDYRIDVVQREAVQVVGLRVRTNVADSSLTCPRLWSETFGPRMEEVSTFAGDSYGVSVMADETSFDYWAALLYFPDQPIPRGMETLTIPGGLYAGCHLDGLPGLAMAYQYIYHIWGPGSDYEFILEAPCYELYPADHMQTGCLSLYMPVRERGAP
ncbi:MAG: GyrI-like domain-containing protein [Candidatus Adiutrix sp.]|jgi:predicted transcriptional regulator YdeE|nr:GyrI-like domain-containing protein [Candidatus Adiutrix sp.]